MIREQEKVIEDIKKLVKKKGFIYALCMILNEDFRIDIESSHKVDNYSRLSVKETVFLLGFLVQSKLDFSKPDSNQDIISIKHEIYVLMRELHNSFHLPFIAKLKKGLEQKDYLKEPREEMREFFGTGDMIQEPIMYSGTGAYDIQYLEYLKIKYKYDKDWLLENRNFDINMTKLILSRIKEVLQDKKNSFTFYDVRDKMPLLIEQLKTDNPDEDWDTKTEEIKPVLEMHQYVDLFFPENEDYTKEMTTFELGEKGWNSFFRGIIDLFVIEKSDFSEDLDVDSFLDNFSISSNETHNSQFKAVGDYNIINAKPIIQLDQQRYFVPISYLVFEAVYESPFYWMYEDKSYRNQLSKHRGDVGEEISHNYLKSVFGTNNSLRAVKVTRKKGQDDTDIDVLCILGNKALVVQIKSKKLTLHTQAGDTAQLSKDFKGAVQDAYKQGIIARNKILDRSAKFYKKDGSELILSDQIDEVYIMGITAENYSSLTHQAHIMLEKQADDPYPVFMTIFDLELIAHYLKDPFDFLYYIRQRISLIESFKADEEMVYLGYHLKYKLSRISENHRKALWSDFGQLIDRNYYPYKLGIEVPDDTDPLKNCWKNEDFDKLLSKLKTMDSEKRTDIIFHLLDFSGDSRDNLMRIMKKLKKQTEIDGKGHDFTLPPIENISPRVGLSYISENSNDHNELRHKLLTFCQYRKYVSKGDAWIGLGSLKNSSQIIDSVVFNNDEWEYNEELDKLTKVLIKGKTHGRQIRIGKKVGRNDPCPCGSGDKYKRCCGFYKNKKQET